MTFTVAIADTDEKSLNSIAEIMKTMRVRSEDIAIFSDGKKLLNFLKHNDVKFVICECELAFYNGYKISEYVSEFKPETMVILTGTVRSYEAIKTALNSGARNYILKPVAESELVGIIKKLVASQTECSAVALKSIVGYIEDIVANKFSIEELTATQNDKSQNVIERANEYIRENYSKDITRKDVAEAVFMNPSYFSIYYKKMTGMFYSDYLTKVRIEKAKALMNQDKRISEVATAVGYHTRRYFNLNFENIVGMTPKEYKESIANKTKK